MGTDNLHHKRKAKSTKDLKRITARREPYKKILIVCEGQKTEPNYFIDLCKHYNLSTVEIRGDCGSDPMSIVEFAKNRFKEEKNAGDPFDQVYCVFDKDEHSTYAAALKALENSTPKNVYFAIHSVPCFEYWLLLHFVNTAKPYNPLPGKSTGSQVLSELKKYLVNYEKGRQQIFSALIEQLEDAKSRAEKILQDCSRSGTDNPSTNVHRLVQVLQDLKK